VATSLRAFNIGLYEEHLDEISFLYEQRGVLLGKPELGWRDLAPFEARLEAHLDALLVGDKLALEVCSRSAQEDDVGRLFGAVCVYCRRKEAPLLSEVFKNLDFANPKSVATLTDALKFEVPDDWSSFIVQALTRQEPRLTPILAAVSGYRRLGAAAPALIDALKKGPTQARSLIDALGQLRAHDAEETLSRYLSHPDADVRGAALLASLRCASADSLEAALMAAAHEPRSHIPLAVAAGRSATSGLLQSLQASTATPDSLLALGLLGDPLTLRVLYDTLDDSTLAPAAAQALQWITGAAMEETIFVPEEVDEAVLFEAELQTWKQHKEPPKRLDGKPFGEVTKKLSVDKDAWKHWFAENASRFDAGLRYRHGTPVTPSALLADLAAADSSSVLRRYTALELEIRYGCDVAFEVDMPVAAQIEALRRITAWVHAQEGRFQEGLWY
jgi:uncharacterized protein (TIGR02270 family)